MPPLFITWLPRGSVHLGKLIKCCSFFPANLYGHELISCHHSTASDQLLKSHYKVKNVHVFYFLILIDASVLLPLIKRSIFEFGLESVGMVLVSVAPFLVFCRANIPGSSDRFLPRH